MNIHVGSYLESSLSKENCQLDLDFYFFDQEKRNG